MPHLIEIKPCIDKVFNTLACTVDSRCSEIFVTEYSHNDANSAETNLLTCKTTRSNGIFRFRHRQPTACTNH